MELSNFNSYDSSHRYSIDHKSLRFKYGNQLLGDTINGIIIGYVQKRIAWPTDTSITGMKPLCKSPNNIIGYPTEAGRIMYADVFGTERVFQCIKCPLNKWSNNGQPCQKKGYIIMTKNKLLNEVFVIELSRSGIPVYKKYAENFSHFAGSYHNIIIRIDGRSKGHSIGGVNVYGVPKITLIDMVDKEPGFDKAAKLKVKEVIDALETESLPSLSSPARGGSLVGMQMGTSS